MKRNASGEKAEGGEVWWVSAREKKGVFVFDGRERERERERVRMGKVYNLTDKAKIDSGSTKILS